MFQLRSSKRKHHPGFESLESKQLLSVGIPTSSGVPAAPAAVLVERQPKVDLNPCGTGKGIIIVTS